LSAANKNQIMKTKNTKVPEDKDHIKAQNDSEANELNQMIKKTRVQKKVLQKMIEQMKEKSNK